MSADSTRPNIVLILLDDMGFSDIGCYGSEIRTPNLDGLAERGIRYTQFANCARCCPTRASLLTGLYPHQAGVGFMMAGNRFTRALTEKHDPPQYRGYLGENCVTIAEALGAAGYQTFMSGKWHAGALPGQRPRDRGFQRYFGMLGGAGSYWRPTLKGLLLDDDPLTELPEDFYTTDYFSDYAARFIREADAERPFFLYLAYNAPHWPLHAWPEDIARYRGKYMIGWDEVRRRRLQKQKEMGLFGAHVRLSPRDEESYPWEEEQDKDRMDHRMATYAAMVDRVDQGIGRVLAALRERGMEENTLIMFLSDNGGCAEPYGKFSPIPPGPAESATGYLLPWANASNTPFRLFKHWTHEGGIATPFIVCWPQRAPAGGINTTQIGHVKDLMPTCLEAAGAEYPASYDGREVTPCAGRSLLHSVLDPESVRNEPVFWEHEGNRAVRAGRWKLVSYYNDLREDGVGAGHRTGRWELYDLDRDPTELINRADIFPEKAAELMAMYEDWAAETGVIDWEEILKMGGLHRAQEK